MKSKDRNIRISLKAYYKLKNVDTSPKRAVEKLLGISNPLDTHISESQKPKKELLDSLILLRFDNAIFESSYDKNEIFWYVKSLMESLQFHNHSWLIEYKIFMNNSDKRMSKFKIYLDNRIKSLTNSNYLEKTGFGQKSKYVLSLNGRASEKVKEIFFSYIRRVLAIYPNSNVDIPKIDSYLVPVNSIMSTAKNRSEQYIEWGTKKNTDMTIEMIEVLEEASKRGMTPQEIENERRINKMKEVFMKK
jgi:hypothetical protein|tara:strand:+ start:1784 stop:2524 length:741 start_codon:yes stop_codon:yes gene_type:complete